MKQAVFTDENYGLDLTKNGDYVQGGTRFDHSTRYESDIFYVSEGKVVHYLAVGDDELDVERDWAFEWASMFTEEPAPASTKQSFLQSLKSTFGLA